VALRGLWRWIAPRAVGCDTAAFDGVIDTPQLDESPQSCLVNSRSRPFLEARSDPDSKTPVTHWKAIKGVTGKAPGEIRREHAR